MLLEVVLPLALSMLAGVLDAVLPDMSTALPDLAGAFSGVATLNAFFPITETAGVAAMLLGVQGVMFVVKLTQTIVAHIPLIGGGGG